MTLREEASRLASLVSKAEALANGERARQYSQDQVDQYLREQKNASKQRHPLQQAASKGRNKDGLD